MLVVVRTGAVEMEVDEEVGMALSGSTPAKRPRGAEPSELPSPPPETGDLQRPLMANSQSAAPQASSLNDIKAHDHFLAGRSAVVGPVDGSNIEKKHTSVSFDLCSPRGLLNGDALLSHTAGPVSTVGSRPEWNPDPNPAASPPPRYYTTRLQACLVSRVGPI